MPPVHEADGQQISPDQPFATWLGKRGQLAAAGLPQTQAGDITYVLATGPQGREMYPYHRNWSPRIGLAWAPSGEGGFWKALFGPAGKTSIRAGFGMYYDVIGQPLANLYNATAFGLATSLTTPLNTLDLTTAPRFTDFWSIPTSILPAAPKGGFPTKYPNAFAITNSSDDSLDSPYTMNTNFSWGREFGHGLFIQLSYVGRLSRHSLIQRDIAMPTNLRDLKSGMTYFQAMGMLGNYVDYVDATRSTAYQRIMQIPFFENLWSGAAGGGFTATQNIANYYIRASNKDDFTNVLNGMDEICSTGGTTFRSNGAVRTLGCSIYGPNAMFNPQFSALAGWSSLGSGAYHSAQLTVRKRFTENVLFDFNYTFGKSVDLSSGAESSGSFGGGFITNKWNPGLQRGVSSYDTLHQVNAYGVWRLPFGRGMRFGSQMNSILDAFIGGWQLSGTYRQTSGLPMSTSVGSVWPTNWQLSNPAMSLNNPNEPSVGILKNGVLINGSRSPSLFTNPAASLASYRETFPGEYGTRGNLRGSGYFNIDTGLSKTIKMPYKEGHSIQIRWESFNMTNTIRLSGASMSLTDSGNWGKLSNTRGDPRQMQFALRYLF